MKNDKIKIVERAGGLVETNSSSSHALSICSAQDTVAKPGDPEFDLDIRDNILYVPERIDDFGWEYEKSNSCQTKLQYVCGLVFNNWRELHVQKAPKRLEILLKKYLGVDRVVFEWEEKYKKHYKAGKTDGEREEEVYLSCPEIDHQSRSESMEEILESNTTILNFIFNKNSWYFGGNDNSDAPDGYYREMSIDGSLIGDEEEMINATVSLVFGGSLGKVDFRVNMYTEREGLSPGSAGIIRMIENSDGFGLFKYIGYNKDKAEFEILDLMKASSAYSADCDFVDENNKCFLVFVNQEGTKELMSAIKEDQNNKKKKGSEMTAMELVNHISEENRLFIPVQLVSDEFGEIYVP